MWEFAEVRHTYLLMSHKGWGRNDRYRQTANYLIAGQIHVAIRSTRHADRPAIHHDPNLLTKAAGMLAAGQTATS